MAYKNFTLSELKHTFHIKEQTECLFHHITPLEETSWLKETLKRTALIPLKSEKSRSELVVMPILLELKARNNDFFMIYSGDTLIADKPKGLIGECDFILTKNVNSYSISTPIISIVEAKKNDIEHGIDQCAAQMIGAKMVNEKEHNAIDIIYGCVTTADDWQFLKLEKDVLFIDNKKYYFENLTLILGIFQNIIDYYKQTLK